MELINKNGKTLKKPGTTWKMPFQGEIALQSQGKKEWKERRERPESNEGFKMLTLGNKPTKKVTKAKRN